MTRFFFNGVEVDYEEMMEMLHESQDFLVEEEKRIQQEHDVSLNTAAAILYLRGRSRWTREKEKELIHRDHGGNPIHLGKVLSGEF